MLRSTAAVITSVMEQPLQLALEASCHYAYWRLAAPRMARMRPRIIHVAAAVSRGYVTYEEVL